MNIYQSINKITKVANGYIVKSEDSYDCAEYEETHIFKTFPEVIDFLKKHFREEK